MIRWYQEKVITKRYVNRWGEWEEIEYLTDPTLQYMDNSGNWQDVKTVEKIIDKRGKVLDPEKSVGEMSKMPEYPRTTTYVEEPLGQMDLFGLP